MGAGKISMTAGAAQHVRTVDTAEPQAHAAVVGNVDEIQKTLLHVDTFAIHRGHRAHGQLGEVRAQPEVIRTGARTAAQLGEVQPGPWPSRATRRSGRRLTSRTTSRSACGGGASGVASQSASSASGQQNSP